MPLNLCASCGLLVTALAALMVVPLQYYLAPPPPEQPFAQAAAGALGALGEVQLPTLDIILTAALAVVVGFIYLCEWIQRKLLERRIIKLNQYLGASVERLRAWDVQQGQLEATLKLVTNATAEYNLLLYLMLRQRRGPLASAPPKPQPCIFDKEFEDPYLRSPTVEV